MNGNRQRSLERAISHIGLVVVETPQGFEVDRFVEHLLTGLGGPGELLDPDDIDGNARPPTAILRAPLQAGLRGWRDTVVRRFEEQKPTVVLLPAGVSGDVLINEPVPTLLIDAAALRMTVPDILDMARSRCGDGVMGPGIAELLGHLSDGWPIWLFACCDMVQEQQLGVDRLASTVGKPSFRNRIVDRFLRDIDRADSYRLAQLAHFGQFSDKAATALGGAEFAFAVLPRAPGLYRAPSGQLRFVEPVRLALVEEISLDQASAEMLAPVLVAEGEVLRACQALLEAGLHDQACSMIEALPGRVVDMTDQRELLGVLRVLADRVGDHPALALKQARVHANLAEISSSVESCQLAIEASLNHDPVRLEASVELLLYRHRSISQEEAADALARLRGEVGVGGPLPTRLREIEAQILGQSSDPMVVQAAADRFVEVASEWEYQQEWLRAAKTLRGLAYGPLWHLGQYREAQVRLDKAARLAIRQTFDYGVSLTFKCFFDARCGDFESYRRASEQASLLVAESGLRWLEAYLYLAAAYEGASQGSGSSVSSATRRAMQSLGPLYETDTGVIFAAESAALLAQVSLEEEACSLLDSVRQRRQQNPLEFDLAEVIVLARSGDIEAARRAWVELLRSELFPNDRRWRAELEIARAEVLAGMTTDVDIEQIRNELERLSLSGLFEQLAPELGSMSSVQPVIDVRLFGDLSVVGPSGAMDIPEGHVTELLKILGVRGGSATVDAVVDHLWPDADRALGARRLKNVLVKAREHFGAATFERDPERVGFGPHVRIDASSFDQHWAEFRTHGPMQQPLAAVAALAAIDLYEAPLLQHDHFSDAIVERRNDLAKQASEMIAFLDGLGAGERPSAAWLAAAHKRVNTS